MRTLLPRCSEGSISQVPQDQLPRNCSVHPLWALSPATLQVWPVHPVAGSSSPRKWRTVVNQNLPFCWGSFSKKSHLHLSFHIYSSLTSININQMFLLAWQLVKKSQRHCFSTFSKLTLNNALSPHLLCVLKRPRILLGALLSMVCMDD